MVNRPRPGDAELEEVPWAQVTPDRPEPSKGWGSRVDFIVLLGCLLLLGIVGVLALRYVKGLSGREQCNDRMRAICLATHQFEDANRYLPYSTFGKKLVDDPQHWLDAENDSFWRHQQNTSALAQIAPFLKIETETVSHVAFDRSHSLIDFDGEERFEWQGDIAGALAIASTKHQSWLCPSDSFESDLEVIIATQPITRPLTPNGNEPKDFHDDMGLQFWPDAKANQFGRTNYLANGGACGGASFASAEYGQFVGPMLCRRKSSLMFLSNLDGLATTSMFAETIGEISNGKRTQAMSWFWGGHGRGRGKVDFADYRTVAGPEEAILGDPMDSSGIGFGSKHEGVVTFGFCDGAVHNIERDVDGQTLYELFGTCDAPLQDVTGGGNY